MSETKRKIESNITSHRTLADGNCAFNAFALGLCDAISNGLKVDSDFYEACRVHLNLKKADIENFKLWLVRTSHDERQKQLQAILRSIAVTYITQYYNSTYTSVYQSQLWAAYENRNTKGYVDDTFIVHPHINEKFKENNLTEKEMAEWWESTAKKLYFSNIQSGNIGQAGWGSATELDALATYFNISISWKKNLARNPIGVLGGMIQGLSVQEKFLLRDLNIGDIVGDLFKIHAFENEDAIRTAMAPLMVSLKIVLKNYIENIDNNRIDIPEKVGSIKIDDVIIDLLKKRRIISNAKTFINDKGKLLKERILTSIQGIESKELREKVLNAFRPFAPLFEIQHLGDLRNHWEYLPLTNNSNISNDEENSSSDEENSQEEKFAEQFMLLVNDDKWAAAKKYYLKHKEKILKIWDKSGKDVLMSATIHSLSSSHAKYVYLNNLKNMFSLVEVAIKNGAKLAMNEKYENPLHLLAYYPENQWTLALFDKLLKIAKPEDLNAYDIWGKTPLLEAIECGNHGIAMRLLRCPMVEVNSFRISAPPGPLMKHFIKSGTSAYDAAKEQGMHDVALKIRESYGYKPNLRQIEDNVNVDNRQFFRLIAQGNADTIRVLLKYHGTALLQDIDAETGRTILHIACLVGNLEIIKILLNKREIDQIIAPAILSEDEYRKFLNHTDTAGQHTALEKAFWGEHKTRDQQLILFVRCKYFEINQLQGFRGMAPLHAVAEADNLGVILEIAKRKDANFKLKDVRSHTPLRIASSEGNVKTVELFAKLAWLGIDCDPNENGSSMKITEKVGEFIEEDWFMGAHTTLTADDLAKVYDTKEPCRNIIFTYTKQVFRLDIKIPGLLTKEEKKEIEDHIHFFANLSISNPISSILDKPSWFKSQYNDFFHYFNKTQWKTRVEKFHRNSIDDSMNAEFIQFKDKKISMTILRIDEKLVSEPGAIRFNFFETLFKDSPYDPRNEKIYKDMTKKTFKPLLFMVAEKYKNSKEISEKNKYRDTFAALLTFPGVKPNPKGSMEIGMIFLEVFLQQKELSELEDIYNKREERSLLFSTEEKVPALSFKKEYEVLDQDRQNSGPLSKLASILLHKLTLASIKKEYNIKNILQLNRRFDALARLIEGHGVCSAVTFDGEAILVSSNAISETNKKSEEIHSIIKIVFHYFSKYALSISSGRKEPSQEILRFNLIKDVCSLKAAGMYNKGKAEKVILNILNPMLDVLLPKFNQILKMKIKPTRDGVLMDETMKTFFSFFDDKLRKNLDEFLNSSEQKNAIVKMLIRSVIDVVKIERTIAKQEHGFQPGFIDALMRGKISFISEGGDDVHAEMQLVNHLLGRATYSSGRNYYIGISKLCCASCDFIINELNNFQNEYNPIWVDTRGAHGEVFPWAIPEFLKDLERAKVVFASDPELLSAFTLSYKTNRDATLNLFKNFGDAKSAEYAFYNRLQKEPRKNQEQSWSSSGGTSVKTDIPAEKLESKRSAEISHFGLENDITTSIVSNQVKTQNTNITFDCFLRLVSSGNVKEVQWHLGVNESFIKGTDCWGATALMHAVIGDSENIVSLLLSLGADVYLGNLYGDTAITIAQEGYVRFCKNASYYQNKPFYEASKLKKQRILCLLNRVAPEKFSSWQEKIPKDEGTILPLYSLATRRSKFTQQRVKNEEGKTIVHVMKY